MEIVKIVACELHGWKYESKKENNEQCTICARKYLQEIITD